MRWWLGVVLLVAGCGDSESAGGDGGGGRDSSVPDAPPDPEWIPRACTGSDVLCVDGMASGSEDGSAANPYHTVQAAIDAAAAGAFIQVARGTYQEDVVVSGKAVEVYGGFPGAGEFLERNRLAYVTTLQGSGTSSVVLLMEAGASVIDGFTITGGAGYDDGFRREGGGVYASGGAPTISYNLIQNNVLPDNGDPEDNSERGGGIRYDGDATIIRNEIRGNRSERGAGIYGGGGGAIVRNVVVDNIGSGNHGGGLYLAGGTIEVSENFVAGNEIGAATDYGWGGGIFVDASGSPTTATLRRNIVTDNYAPNIGSGVFIDNGAHATLTNELYYRNRCPQDGGAAFYADSYTNDGGDGSIVEITNSTFADHDCTSTEGGMAVFAEGADTTVTIRNCIFWGNGGDDVNIRDNGATADISYTLSSEVLEGTGNLSMDPLFANPSAGDYHLRSTAGRFDPGSASWINDSSDSPAIDSGDPASDYSAEPTPNGGRVNMGSYANTGEASKSP